MAVKFSPSVNIIRDSKKDIKYVPTPNAEKVVKAISEAFHSGIHAFTLIGSYGTGKSSFLWAFQQSLQNKNNLLECKLVDASAPVKILNLVGTYQSLIDHFAEQLEIKNSLKGNQQIFDALYQEYEKVKGKNGLLIISIDEFGKFLEHAVKHDPNKELYFIQQLAEFVNDSDRNILLLTTLHQNFEAYSDKQLNEAQRQEWRKVKGRLKEITFNEPIEQLLLLAAKSLGVRPKNKSITAFLLKIEKGHHILSVDNELIKSLGDSLHPLDFFSAYVLTKALQRYGQNERSLFTFLETEKLARKKTFGLSEVYDYLFNEYYSYLTSKNNTDYTAWALVRESIERVESKIQKPDVAINLLKVIGLVRLFGSKAAKIDDKFLVDYFNLVGYPGKVKETLKQIKDLQVVSYSRFNQSYKPFEGTDVNIEEELQQAEKDVADELDIVEKLKDHFDFPYITAKAISYKIGTPRLFEFTIIDTLAGNEPHGEVDGYINLIFSTQIKSETTLKFSKSCGVPILFGYFNNTKQIKDTLHDIQKTQLVLSNNAEDKVAKRELTNILGAQRQLLNHFVWDSFYSGDVTWIYKGKKVKIESRRELNQQLSLICSDVYSETPVYRNELINKHTVSSSIHTARKNYFAALVNSYTQADFGFAKEAFPPEKTIYITLLKETKIHTQQNSNYWDLDKPQGRSAFTELWNASEAFLESCKIEKRPLNHFFEELGRKPFKLKQGFLEFWIPTFLFIKRDDFALFGDQGYIPELNDTILYLFNRNTQEFYIKTFDVRGVKLNLYNRYREFLQLRKAKKASNESFIESIRPFLVLYKQLPEYARMTNRLSPETIAIRKAIENSQDPEKVFFEDFPSALKTDIKKLSSSKGALEDYIANLQNAIRELRTCVDDLTDRIELFLVKEVLGNKKLKFETYKSLLQERYSNLKEHQLLPKQQSFLMRINSPLDERKSWIASIVHAVLNKSLEAIRDEDEEILKDRLLFLVQEMDNMNELASSKQSDQEEVIKLDVTTSAGLTKSIIRIPKGKKEEIKKMNQEIKKLLGKDKRINLASLSELLKEQLKK